MLRWLATGSMDVAAFSMRRAGLEEKAPAKEDAGRRSVP
jgi:hypothetical protein